MGQVISKIIKVRVPATTANLGPGFDVLGAALKLYNEITVSVIKRSDGKSGPEIEIEGEGSEVLPRDGENIIWQSMKNVFEIFPVAGKKFISGPCSVRIKVKNNIPLCSGLGSSAAARLSGILAANEITGRKLTSEKIMSLGVDLEGHPDNIVPAIAGSLCVTVMSSKEVRYIKLPAPKFKVVVCVPDFELKTGDSREILPKDFSLETMVFNSSRIALLLASLQTKKYEMLGVSMEDKLHQPSREKLVPGMNDILSAAKKAGAYGASLSGAGPSIVAFCHKSIADKIGRIMKNRWCKYKISSRYYVLDFDKYGAKTVTVSA